MDHGNTINSRLQTYLKEDFIDEKAISFIADSLEKHKANDIQICMEMLSVFHQLLVKYVLGKTEKKEVSLSSAVKLLPQDDPSILNRQSFVKDHLYKAFDVAKYLIVETKQLENYPQLASAVILLCEAYFSSIRFDVLDNTKTWKELFRPAKDILRCISPALKEQVVPYVVESWFFCLNADYSVISEDIDIILSGNPKCFSALLCRSHYFSTLGLFNKCSDDFAHIIQNWSTLESTFYVKNESDAKSTTVLSIEDTFVDKLVPKWAIRPPYLSTKMVSTSVNISLSAIGLIVSQSGLSFVDFRGLKDTAISSQTFSCVKLIVKISGFLGELRDSIKTVALVTRVKALAFISQLNYAKREAVDLLPELFTSELKISSLVVSTTSPRLSSAFTQRAMLSAMVALELYEQGILYADSLLASNPTIVSWILVEKAWMQQLEVMKKWRSMYPHNKLLRDIDFSSSDVDLSPIFGLLNAVVDAADIVSQDLLCLVKLRQGILCWHAGGSKRADKDGCLALLLAAAKFDPNCSSVYTYIGHYYMVHMGDKDKAMKCYLKALGLNPLDAEAGVSCSQIYIENQSTEKLLKFWTDISALSPHAYWMHSSRGHYYSSGGDYENGIVSFQVAIGIYSGDVSSWKGLGFCYHALHQNTAAVKTFLKALEFDPTDIVILCCLGDVERRLGDISSAMNHYSLALASQAENVVALKGLGDCCLALAFKNMTAGWTSGAAENIKKGTEYTNKALRISPRSSSLWKLQGDLYLFSHNLSVYDYDCSDIWNDDPLFESGLFSLLRQAENSYRKVLQIALENTTTNSQSDNLAELYYDIGNSLYQYAVAKLQSLGHCSGLVRLIELLPLVQDILLRAREEFSNGIRADPSNSSCWNGLGLAFIGKNIEMQQACFLKAIHIDNNPQAFANLAAGSLFLGHDRIARSCYTALQQLESNPLFWVGLGVIFERAYTESTASLPSIHDAYAAAMEVSKPTEALIGKALSWLRAASASVSTDNGISSLSKTDVLHNVEHPLLHYLRRRPVHPTAWIIYAWSLLHRGDFIKAIVALKKAAWSVDLISAKVIPSQQRSNFNRDKLRELISMYKLSAEVKLCIINNSKLFSESINGVLAKEKIVCHLEKQSAFGGHIFSILASTSEKDLSEITIRSIVIASCIRSLKNADSLQQNLRLFIYLLKISDKEDRDLIMTSIDNVLRSAPFPADEEKKCYADQLFAFILGISNSHSPPYTQSKLLIDCVKPALALYDSSTRANIQLGIQDLSNEVRVSWPIDDVGYCSDFLKSNMGDDRLGFLITLLKSLKYFTDCKAGVHFNDSDLQELKRSIFLTPDVVFTRDVFSIALFSTLILESYTLSQEISSESFMKDVKEKLSLIKTYCPEDFLVSHCLSIYSSLITSNDMKEVFDRVKAHIDGPSIDRTLLSYLCKQLGDNYVAANSFSHAEKCYGAAREVLESCMKDSPGAIVIELHDILRLAYLYRLTSKFDDISAARSKAEALCLKFNTVAATKMVLAFIWQLLKKPQKVELNVTEGKALWSDAVAMDILL